MNKLAKFKVKPIVTNSTGWKLAQPEKINPEVIVARAGTVVVCPKCGTKIGRLFSDLYSGVSCRADQIEFEHGQKKHPNQLAECNACKAPYMKMDYWVRAGLPTTIRTILSVHMHGAQRWI